MEVLRVRNVRHALPFGVEWLLVNGVREGSRNGPVLVSPVPVTTVYERPTERVLFSAVRDANPFFHVAEALWMLAGRDDTGFLDYFVRDFGARFGDGVPPRMHGAYGHRWRVALGYDQLDVVVEQLRQNPTSRQAVIQMWDAGDLHHQDYDIVDYGSNDLRGDWRDRPCNTHAYLRVCRDGAGAQVLDLTVCCRSNDILMGAYGANAVHFSVLQEYLAARIGVGVGRYYQVSNNFHMYEADWDRIRRRAGAELSPQLVVGLLRDERSQGKYPLPLANDPEGFYREVTYLINAYETLGEGPPDEAVHAGVRALRNHFLAVTAWPMMMAHRAWKLGADPRGHEVQRWVGSVQDVGWRIAADEWLRRRAK